MAQMPFSPCDTASGAACTDRSVSMLRDIFGPVIDALVQGTDPNTVAASANVIATMMSFFNSGILVIGSLIVSYVAVMGITNTANDGEAMGKSWSSLWTPVRIVAGGAVLLPTASGYSFIQLVVLLFSLWGVGFANGTYKVGMAIGVLSPNGVVQGVNDPGQFFGLRDFAKQYLAASYCAKAANTIYWNPADGTGPQVMATGTPDKTISIKGRTEYTFYIKDRNVVTNLAGGEPFCGTVKIASYAAQSSDDATGIEAALETLRVSTQTIKINAAVAMMGKLDAWVNSPSWPKRVGDAGWDQVDSTQFNEIVNEAELSITTGLMAQMSNGESGVKAGFSTFSNSLTSEGWAMAGGWFQRVGEVHGRISATLSEAVGSVGPPSLTALPSDAASSELLNSVTTVTEAIYKKAETKGNFKPSTNSVGDLTNVIPKDANSDINIGSIQNDMDSKVSLFVNSLMESMVGIATGVGGNGVTPLCGPAGQMGGSLNRMKCVGDYLTVARVGVGAADVAIKTGATGMRIVTAWVFGGIPIIGEKAVKSADALWDWVLQVPIKQLAIMASYLEPMAFYFGVFLPSLPYTIFMIVVVGWILAVVQSLIAAPLWAVMHMTPDRTFIGSQSQGYLLLLSLFARPALSVVGLFAAILVSDPIIDFIAKGFFSMRGAVVTSTGTVGTIASFLTFAWWFMVFGLTLLPVLYMTFGLPQILPDHVLKWIGAGIGDLGETSASGEMRRGMQSAAAAGGSSSGGGGAAVGRIAGSGGGDLLSGGGGSGANPPPSNGGSGAAIEKRGLLSAGDQGVTSANSAPTATTCDSTRSGGQKASDAAGVAIGRAITGGVASAARSAGRMGNAVVSGGREGVSSYQEAGSRGASFGQRVKAGLVGGAAVAGAGLVSAGAASASDFSQAGKTAVSEGKAAYSEGADSRIAAFKSELRGDQPVNASAETASTSAQPDEGVI